MDNFELESPPSCSNPHRIEVVINRYGVSGAMRCDAPSGANCRMWCDNGCERHYGDSGCVLTDQGHCLQTEGWFDEVFECYAGDEAPLRSGPVELIWEPDFWTWVYEGVSDE